MFPRWNEHTRKRLIRIWRSTVFIQLIALFIFVPSVIRWYKDIGPLPELLAHYSFAMFGWLLLGAAISHVHARAAVAMAMTLSYTVEAFLCAYELKAGFAPSMHFILDSHSAAIPAAIAVLGMPKMILVFVALSTIALWSLALFRAALRRANEFNRVRRGRVMVTTIACAAIGITLIFAFGRVPERMTNDIQLNNIRRDIPMIFPENGGFSTKSDDNVFIVQLESVNALALEGTLDGATPDATFRRTIAPVLSSLTERGVFFPLFWGNAMMTNRAQESILCRVVRNVQVAISFELENLIGTCLPHAFERSGYDAFAYRSDDLEFSNQGAFLFRTGFEAVHNQDIGRPDDVFGSFGYDDCTFYARSFEHLRSVSTERSKTFVYVEVVSNHYPFRYETKARSKPFPHPSTFRENLLNSIAAQDECLGVFMEGYDAFAPESSHLFIMPDHSWPSGYNGSTFNSTGASPENFLVNLLYVPPAGRAGYDRGSIAEERFSQTDIMGTIFDLLNGTSSAQSFAWRLRGETKPSDYENCHVLTQPYDNGNVVVVRGNEYFLYKLVDRTITLVDLAHDLRGDSPSIVEQNVNFTTFWEKYGCEKYR